jgi:hypothetical protein
VICVASYVRTFGKEPPKRGDARPEKSGFREAIHDHIMALARREVQ